MTGRVPKNVIAVNTVKMLLICYWNLKNTNKTRVTHQDFFLRPQR
ncbi:hypothetical protein E2C01_070621 [Portunus trituberculatus]|uniref:Uncharacterized protein n=1 Tax=Portunus trituberculatus TaxID=210409 RepID=A0A5B7I5X3_PORTR|nr:hypothetical protein [Portunus trituberculatus]